MTEFAFMVAVSRGHAHLCEGGVYCNDSTFIFGTEYALNSFERGQQDVAMWNTQATRNGWATRYELRDSMTGVDASDRDVLASLEQWQIDAITPTPTKPEPVEPASESAIDDAIRNARSPTKMTSTYDHARRCDAGQIFHDGNGNRAIYSDRSDSARKAYGWLIWADGTKGTYQLLPDNLYPERYNITDAHNFAQRIKALGFRVWLAKSREYGFISDETGERVLSFSFGRGEYNLGGNYGPPSRESGTGWRLGSGPASLRTAQDVKSALYATAPDWCGKGWRYYTSVAGHLGTYHASSVYQEV